MALTTVKNAGLAGSIDLTAKVTGTLPIANGGTNSTSTTFVNAATNVTGTLATGNGGTGSTATTFVNVASNVTGTLPAANGGTGVTSYAPGKVLQVVTATSDNNNTTTSGSWATHSGFPTVSITPSSSSNKVYVHVSSSFETSSGTTSYFTLYRDDTTNLGTALDGLSKTQVGGEALPASMAILDSPSSTSAVEYQVYAYNSSAGNHAYVGKGVLQTITAFEIEG